jgi:acyl carrier protein
MFKAELASFIEQKLVGDDRRIAISEKTLLIEEGIIDSMGLLQIVLFLEERAGVRVPDDEVSPENFETIEAIEGLVARLQAYRKPTRDEM